MQRFSFVVLTTLLLLVMFSIGCQNNYEERISALEAEHTAKINLLEEELLKIKWMQAKDAQVTDALFYKVICMDYDGLHDHGDPLSRGSISGVMSPLNVALVYSDSETGTLYDLQPIYPHRVAFRHLVCDGVSMGVQNSAYRNEQFDPDVHPIQDVTLTNATLVEKLCRDNLFSEDLLEYVKDEYPFATDGMSEGIQEMCATHNYYMTDYRQLYTPSVRAWRFRIYNELRDLLNPPEETPEKTPEE